MGCGNEIIGSDGDKVVRKISPRYQLAGEIQHGDVSLTILNIIKTDSGKYGCRIHVPGLFNDEMYYVHLIVNDGKCWKHSFTMPKRYKWPNPSDLIASEQVLLYLII